jgi:Sulfotransferase domain
VDHLMRWSRFFKQEQILVLKSEDLFERTQDTLKEVQGFLGLPEYWAPETLGKRNKGVYDQEGIDSATRQQLEAFYNPHNQRLYEYLSVDIGWENSCTGELVYGA